MIIIKQGEELRRRFNGKLKKFGDGIFYVTSTRFCFESKKNGLCFELDYGYLYNWEIKNKKTIIIRWQEPVSGYNRNDPIIETEIEIKKKDGKRPKIEDVIDTMFYAFTDRYPYGPTGMGMYMNTKNEVFDLYTKMKPKPLTFELKEALFDMIQLDQFGKVQEATGETLLDQERFKRFTMWQALDLDGKVEAGRRGGLMDPTKIKLFDYTELKVQSYNALINGNNNIIKRILDRIEKWKQEGNTFELTKLVPERRPNENNEIVDLPRPACTTEEEIKWYKSMNIIYQRTIDLISKETFDFDEQAQKYTQGIQNKLVTKYSEGGNISTYFPIVEKISSYTIKAKQEIEEYRKKLTEKV